MYTHRTSIRLRDTDAAGITYFASQLGLAHGAFEAYLDSEGLNVGDILQEAEYAFPIVHVEATYKKPLRAGDAVEIRLGVKKIGNTSFTIEYRFLNRSGEEAGTACITHVAMDRRSQASIPLPEKLRGVLDRLAADDG